MDEDLASRLAVLDALEAFLVADTPTFVDHLPTDPIKAGTMVWRMCEQVEQILRRWCADPLAAISMQRLELYGSDEVTEAMREAHG